VPPAEPETLGKAILIVAIDHGLQLAREATDSPQLATQKDQLEALLRSEIPKRKVRFISEESDPQKTTIARALAKAAELCREKAAARLQLFDWLLFNVLIGNGDNHLKNISFIVDLGGIHIAPAYDLLCTSAYDTRAVANENAHWPDSPLAIPLEGATTFGEVRRSHLTEAARALGIAAPTAQRYLDRMLKGILNKADQLIAAIGGDSEQQHMTDAADRRVTNQDAFAAIRAGEARLLDVMRHIVLADMVKQLV